MAHLLHSVHAQLVGLWLGCVGWILSMVTAGLVQWRVWEVVDVSNISSGVAWVGVWKVCFYSYTLVTAGRGVLFCQRMSISDSFVPMEIGVAQVLMLVALVVGAVANGSTIYGLRNAFFGLDKRRPIRLAFATGGLLHLLTSLCCLLPLTLNLRAVATNQNISFPDRFHMPPVPTQQRAGAAIGVGIAAALLSLLSGLLFLGHRFPVRTSAKVQPTVQPSWTQVLGSEDGSTGRPPSPTSALADTDSGQSRYARDNAAFQSDELV